MLRLIESRHRVGITEIVERLEGLRDLLEGNARNPSGGKQGVNKGSENTMPTLDGVKSRWQEVLDAVGEEKPLLKSYLMEGAPLAIEGDTLIVSFEEAFDFHRGGLEDFNNKRFLEAVLSRVLGASLRIGFKIRASEKKELKKKAKNNDQLCRDPVIQKAMSVFNAEVVDVKK